MAFAWIVEDVLITRLDSRGTQVKAKSSVFAMSTTFAKKNARRRRRPPAWRARRRPASRGGGRAFFREVLEALKTKGCSASGKNAAMDARNPNTESAGRNACRNDGAASAKFCRRRIPETRKTRKCAKFSMTADVKKPACAGFFSVGAPPCGGRVSGFRLRAGPRSRPATAARRAAPARRARP